MASTAWLLRFGTPLFVTGHSPFTLTGVWFPVSEKTAEGGSLPWILHIVRGESLPGYAEALLSPAPAYW